MRRVYSFLQKDEERDRRMVEKEEADALQRIVEQWCRDRHLILRKQSSAAFIGIEITEGILVDTDGNGELDTLVTVEGFEYHGVKVRLVSGVVDMCWRRTPVSPPPLPVRPSSPS